MRQQLLQFVAFAPRQHPLAARPWLQERLAAAQPIRQMSDRQRIGLGRIVFHDHAEVLQHQEPRPLRARRHQQIGAVIGTRERLAAGAADARAALAMGAPIGKALGYREVYEAA